METSEVLSLNTVGTASTLVVVTEAVTAFAFSVLISLAASIV